MKFLSWLLLLLMILSDNSRLRADVTVEEERTDRGTRKTYHMTVTPAAEPVPALKHRLSVEPHQTIAGNSVTHLLRAFGERGLHQPWKDAIDKHGLGVYDWVGISIPLNELPLEKVRDVAGGFDSLVENHIARATICRDIDWGLGEEDLRGMAAIEFLLPSVQETRSIARALAIRTRLAVAEGRYDDAVEHIRMTYHLGRIVSKMKYLVSALVGIADIGIANETMIELIAAEDSPNLYWALAEAPRPLIDLREAMRLEMSFGGRLIPELLGVESAEHTADEWQRILSKSIETMTQIGQYVGGQNSSPDLGPWKNLATAGIGLAGYQPAKQALIDTGMERETVEAMSVGQVMMIDMARQYERIADVYEKSLYVPFPMAREMIRAAEREMQGMMFNFRPGRILAAQLLPAIAQVRNAQVRIEAQRNLLMTVEAIRMHLAATGELPSSLADIRDVPVPVNPYDGEEFKYACDGKSATLDFPFGYSPGYAIRFVIESAK
jgi:hypothetical protein